MAHVGPLIAGPLAEALARGRDRFNARFVRAARRSGRVEGAAFAAILADFVAPVVAAAHAARPERTDAVAEGLYDVALSLLAQDLLGPEGSDRGVFAVWTEVLPAIGARLADAPGRIAAALSNAGHHLAATPGVRLDAYVAECVRLLPRAPSFDALIAASTVLAWRSGLAQALAAAREAFRSLPDGLAELTLGVEPGPGPRARSALEAGLADPWRRPGAPGGPPTLRLVGRVAGFRPFGGPFLEPPRVGRVGDRLYAWDRAACVEVHADVFGATWTACGERPPSGVVENGPPWAAGASGDVAMGRVRERFEDLLGAAGHAGTSSTLAVVLRHSHQVHLVALAPEGA